MLQNEIQQILAPLIASLGYELWGCEYHSRGRYALLRVYIDKEDGISLVDCELVSKQVSAVLDVENPIQGGYDLEISSPGVERPLFQKEQYARYIGSQVRITCYQSLNTRKKISGEIVGVSDDSVKLKYTDVSSASKGYTTVEIQFSRIIKANLIGKWGEDG